MMITHPPRRRDVDVYPTGVDYCNALQVGGEPSVATGRRTYADGMLGSPWSAHGRHAIVFRLHESEAPDRALRCFTTAAPDIELRYRLIDRHLRRHPVPALAKTRWIDEGMRVDGRWWPVIEMEWVEGRRLDRWIGEAVRHPRPEARYRLEQIADRWRRLVLDLATAGVAHGDLQHGNVLIDGDGRLRLVDLDGVWVRALADRPSAECGHDSYQHPDRRTTGAWNAHLDGFPALLIWTTLQVLAVDPSLWSLHHPGDDHLLLSDEDLADTGRAAWRRLRSAMAGAGDDPSARRAGALIEKLQHLVERPLEGVPSPLVTLA